MTERTSVGVTSIVSGHLGPVLAALNPKLSVVAKYGIATSTDLLQPNVRNEDSSFLDFSIWIEYNVRLYLLTVS